MSQGESVSHGGLLGVMSSFSTFYPLSGFP